jgi:hypothetical protein
MGAIGDGVSVWENIPNKSSRFSGISKELKYATTPGHVIN